MFVTSLYAFLQRELKNQFGRNRLGYFWALAEPAAMVAVLTIIHAGIRGHGAKIYGEDPVIFFVFGALPYYTFATCVSQTQNVFNSQRGLFNYRQVRPVDVILARCIIDALMLVGVLFLFLLGWWWFGKPLNVEDPLKLAMAFICLFMLGLSLGLFFEVIGTVFPDMRRIFTVLMRPMFLMSGVFFTIEMVPQAYRGILMLNPVMQGVDLARDAVLAGYTSPASYAYVVYAILVLLFLGLSSYRRYMYRLA